MYIMKHPVIPPSTVRPYDNNLCLFVCSLVIKVHTAHNNRSITLINPQTRIGAIVKVRIFYEITRISIFLSSITIFHNRLQFLDMQH
jgi:hypothetical protein